MTDTVMTPPVGASSEPDPDSRKDRTGGRWRPLLVRMHFYAGVLVAPFIFLACLTGAIYVFNPQLDRAMEPGLLVVQHPGTTPLPLNEQVAKALAARPGLNLVSVVPNTRPDETTRVNLYRPGGPDMTNLTVFVNPYTGQVQGAEDISTMGGAMPFSTWMAQFHGDLGLGDFGRWYSELASLWIVVLTVGGLVVWWQRCSVHRGIASRAFWAKFSLVRRGKRPGVQRTMSWHSVIGLWTALFALLFGLTGLPFARETGAKWGAQFGNPHRSSVQLDTRLAGSGGGRPSGGTSAGSGGMSGTNMPGMNMSGQGGSGNGTTSGSGTSGHGNTPASGSGTGAMGSGSSGHDMSGMNMPEMNMSGSGGSGNGSGSTGHATGSGMGTSTGQSGSGGMAGMMVSTGISPSRAAATDFDAMVAAARKVGVDQMIRITSPTRPGTGWTVAENKQDWPVAYDSALIDPTSYQVVRTLDWQRASTATDKLNRYIMLLHFGRLFGLVGQILSAASMLLVMWIVWWGYKMWWQRRPRGSAWRFGKAPARGSWRKAPRVSLVVWSVIALACFWVFPVLAVSVLGFLVLDVALGRIQAARAKAAPAG